MEYEIKGSDIKALKSSIWYTISNFFMRSIGLLTTPIFTRLLSKDEYGMLNNYTSWLSILTILITLNLDSTLISARYDHERKFDEYIFSILTLGTVSTGIWFIVFKLFRKNILSFLGIESIHLNIMFLYLLFLPVVNIFQSRERYLLYYKKNVFLSLGISISTALLSIFLVVNMGNKLLGKLIGSSLPTIIFGIIIYLIFLVKVKYIKFTYWKYALTICLPYIPHALSLMLLNSMDRVMINRICGNEETALYSLAYSCALIITMLFTSLNNAYAPWLGEKLARNDYSGIKSFSKKYIIFFYFLAYALMLIAPELLFVLGGKSYMDALYAIPPVGMGLIAQFTYALFVNIEQFKKKTVGMALASISAAFLNFILNSIFIPQYGFIAASYTTLAGYMWLLIIHMWYVRKLELDVVYDYRFIIVCILVSFLEMILCYVLYSFTILRWIIIFGGLLVLLYYMFLNKNLIIKALKK